MKVLYGVLGLAMTIVCVTGFNVWLARRKRHDGLSRLWAGFVWGAAPGLALSAIAQMVFAGGATATLWLTILAACALGLAWKDERTTKQRLEIAGCAAIVTRPGE